MTANKKSPSERIRQQRRVDGRSRTRRFALLPLWVLVATLVSFAFVAYYPFSWNPPHIVRNDVTRTAPGNLRFGDSNRARSTDVPQWLNSAQTAGRITIDLEARPQFPQRHPPTSIMMMARDFWHTSFAIGQENADLLIWVRRPGSNTNGDPPFIMTEVFRPNHWTKVRVKIVGVRLTVTVDGKIQLHESVPAETLRNLPAGLIALGDEVRGGNGWRGDIRRAEVTTMGDSIDYVQSGALGVPPSYLYLPDHITPFPPPTSSEWFILVLHLLSFIPIGLLLMWTRRPSITVRSATTLSFGLAVVLALGKFLFDGRHTSAADLVVQLLGGFIGAMLGAWALRKVNRRQSVTQSSRLGGAEPYKHDMDATFSDSQAAVVTVPVEE